MTMFARKRFHNPVFRDEPTKWHVLYHKIDNMDYTAICGYTYRFYLGEDAAERDTVKNKSLWCSKCRRIVETKGSV